MPPDGGGTALWDAAVAAEDAEEPKGSSLVSRLMFEATMIDVNAVQVSQVV